jgi:uncharacterized protein (DUF1697 family)
MTKYIALVRAVNVGGTGRLPMSELKAMCAAEGFTNVVTYIASGNVVFDSKTTPEKVKAALEARVAEYAGKPMGVLVRTAKELAAVLAANPFPQAAGKFAYAVFLDTAPPADALKQASGRTDEEMHLGVREIYVHYPSGAGRSKLRIPAARVGTARNMNTIAKLVEMARA